jgi:hypothetical protein
MTSTWFSMHLHVDPRLRPNRRRLQGIAADREHPVRQTMRIGRLKKLEQLGLAEERRVGECDDHAAGRHFGDSLHGKPKSTPRLQVLSPVELARQIDYDGPTWLDRALTARERLNVSATEFGPDVDQALAQRWPLARAAETRRCRCRRRRDRQATNARAAAQHETARLAQTLSRELKALHVPHEPGSLISGVYERSIKLSFPRHLPHADALALIAARLTAQGP